MARTVISEMTRKEGGREGPTFSCWRIEIVPFLIPPKKSIQESFKHYIQAVHLYLHLQIEEAQS